MDLKIYLLAAVAIVAEAQACNSGFVQRPNTEDCFLFVQHGASFDDAQAYCQAQGAELASIHSQEENQWLSAYQNEDPNVDFYHYWVGGVDDGSNTNWEWTDGTPFDYWGYLPGEPNGANERCLLFQTGGYWNDYGCTAGHVFSICKQAQQSNEIPGMVTTCAATEVTVTFDTSVVPNMDTSLLHVGVDPNACRATESGGVITFNFPLGTCDPAVSECADVPGYLCFTHDIYGNSTEATGVITRLNTMGIEVVCKYPEDTQVSANFVGGLSVVEYLGSADGHFVFTMALFEDEEMTVSIPEGAERAVNTPTYAKIHFNGPPSYVKMTVEECVASPTADPEQAVVVWYLVRNGCYGAVGMDTTFEPLPSEIDTNVYGFVFDAFRFLNQGTSNVYITCQVHISRADDGTNQNPIYDVNCPASSKRSTENTSGFTIGSVGFSPVDEA